MVTSLMICCGYICVYVLIQFYSVVQVKFL